MLLGPRLPPTRLEGAGPKATEGLYFYVIGTRPRTSGPNRIGSLSAPAASLFAPGL